MFARRLFINDSDQQAGFTALTPNRQFCELFSQVAGECTSFRFALRQEDANRRIPAPEKSGEMAIDQNHACSGGASHRMMYRQVGVLVFDARPRQNRAVRVRRIGRRQINDFRRSRFRAQTAQHIHRGRHRELRGAKPSHEHAAPGPAAFFHGFERGIDGVVAARNIFSKRGFTGDDSIVNQQLLRNIGAPLSWG